jgi:alkylation response protein AidB-like acyl-CoA dehydrogenase
MISHEENDLHCMLRDQACELSARILREDGPVPQREECTLLRRFRDLKGAGYPGILVPSELDGEGGGWAEAAIITEEVAKGEPVLAMMLLSHLICTAGLLLWADESQARDFLPPLARCDLLGAVALTEPEAGTDFASLRTSLEKKGASAIASGNKCFVTNTAPGEESGVLAFLRGHDGIAAAYIPLSSPGLHLAHRYRFSGWEGLPNHALVLQECTFPAGNLLQEGLQRDDLLPLFDEAALLVTAMAAGMARACLEVISRYVLERKQGGKRLADHQALYFRASDMATCIELIKTSLHLAAARLDAGKSCHRELCMLKLFAGRDRFLRHGDGRGIRLHPGLPALQYLPRRQRSAAPLGHARTDAIGDI